MPISVILIICMQLIIVPLTTLRTTFMVKGKIKLASAIGGIESLIYVISLSVVFSDLSNYMNMVAYAIGYAGGVIIGGTIERFIAVGYRIVHVNLTNKDLGLVDYLRTQGFGITMFEGEGINGEKRYRLDILVKRNREKELMGILDKQAPKAFITAYEPTSFKGGYLEKSMKKNFISK